MSVIDDQRIAVLMGRSCVGSSLRKAGAGNRSSWLHHHKECAILCANCERKDEDSSKILCWLPVDIRAVSFLDQEQVLRHCDSSQKERNRHISRSRYKVRSTSHVTATVFHSSIFLTFHMEIYMHYNYVNSLVLCMKGGSIVIKRLVRYVMR